MDGSFRGAIAQQPRVKFIITFSKGKPHCNDFLFHKKTFEVYEEEKILPTVI